MVTKDGIRLYRRVLVSRGPIPKGKIVLKIVLRCHFDFVTCVNYLLTFLKIPRVENLNTVFNTILNTSFNTIFFPSESGPRV